MTIDEAIKHAEEVAEKNEKKAKSYPRPDKNVKGSGRKYNDCIECASEHRQLAEWLKDYKRLLEQEPRTGHWVKHDTGHSIYYDCSLCGCAAPCTETADKILWKMANYCPDCGAKMQEVEE